MFLLYKIVNSIVFISAYCLPPVGVGESWPGTEAWVGWYWPLQPHCLEAEKH